MQEMSSKFSARELPSTQSPDFLAAITDTLGARDAALKKASLGLRGRVCLQWCRGYSEC